MKNSTGAFLDPVHALVIFTVVPIAVIFILSLVLLEKRSVEGFVSSLSKLYARRSGLLVLLGLVCVTFLCVNQVYQIILNLKVGFDISYYMKVDLPEYDQLNAQTVAATDSSLNTVVLSLDIRRLAASTQSFVIAYRTSSWSNVLTPENLKSICETEKLIQQNMDCFDYGSKRSFIVSICNPIDCNIVNNPSEVYKNLGSEEVTAYFEDNFNANTESPSSHVLFTYIKLGTCGSKSPDTMGNELNSYTRGNIDIVFVSKKLLATEFINAIMHDARLTVIALIASIIFFIIWLRGILTGCMTVLCILVSLICATALLPSWRYESFSAFNIMCVFILVGVGANAVLLFNSAWNKIIPRGETASAEQLQRVYETVGPGIFFTILAAILSLFSKLASPVIVISQLGVFMGTAVIVFYVEYHLLILPVWVITSRFVTPLWLHRALESLPSPHKIFERVQPTFVKSPNILPHQIIELQSPQHQQQQQDEELNSSEHDEEVKADPPIPNITVTSHDSPGTIDSSFISFENYLTGHPRIIGFLTRHFRKIGVLVFMITLAGFVGSFFAINAEYKIDFTIPQLVTDTTNMGQAITMIKNYKSNLFNTNVAKSIPPPGSSTTTVPTRVPTPSPATPAPVIPQLPPTPSPATMVPTRSPVVVPTVVVRKKSYTVKGCWGIDYTKFYRDGDSQVITDTGAFKTYVEDGLMVDLYNLCGYIQTNRDDLGIVTAWDVKKDCIYHQIKTISKTPEAFLLGHTNNSVLLAWGYSSSVNGKLLGVEYSNRTFHSMWLCTSFSALRVVSGSSKSHEVTTLIKRWNDVFKLNSFFALKYGINILVGSDAFTVDLLAAEVLRSVELAGIISIVGFVGLIWVFTWDAGVTFIGTLVMAFVTIVTLCLHLYFASNIVDLLDIVVLIAIIGMIVDFPIHFILDFLHTQAAVEESNPLFQLQMFPPVTLAAVSTEGFMSHALLGPTIMTIIAGIPLLYATLSLLRKTGEYMIVMIVASFIITLILTMWLMPLSPRTRVLERFYLRFLGKPGPLK